MSTLAMVYEHFPILCLPARGDFIRMKKQSVVDLFFLQILGGVLLSCHKIIDANCYNFEYLQDIIFSLIFLL